MFFKAHERLKEFLDQDFNYLYVCKTGYAALYEKLVQKEGLVVKLGHRVQRVVRKTDRRGRGQWVVTCKKKDHRYDVVIVAAPPRSYEALLSDHPVTALMKQATAGPGVRSWLVRVAHWPKKQFGGLKRGSWVLYDTTRNFGSSDLKMNNRVYAFNKEYTDSNILVLLSYADNTTSIKTQKQQMYEDCAALKLRVVEILTHKHFLWPTFVPAAAECHDWYNKLNSIQGQDHMMYVGEVVFSAGVVSQAEGIDNFMPRMFG